MLNEDANIWNQVESLREAWEKLSFSKYYHLRRQCWIKTSCLVSADGSNKNLIISETLLNYDVPPPNCLDPSSQTVLNNLVCEE